MENSKAQAATPPNKKIRIPGDLKELEQDINALLDKNETAIRAYIARYIFTSSISPETNRQLDAIFTHIRDSII